MRLIIFYSLKNLLSIIFTPVDDPIFSIVSFQSGAKPELLGYVTIWNKIQIMRQFRECAFDINASPLKKLNEDVTTSLSSTCYAQIL